MDFGALFINDCVDEIRIFTVLRGLVHHHMLADTLKQPFLGHFTQEEGRYE
jgi:hypothetical protein